MAALSLHVVILLSVFGGVHSGHVWIRISEEAANVLSKDVIEREPEVVFNLSSLVQTVSQVQLTGVRLYTPIGVTSDVQLLQPREGMFTAEWNIESIVVDITGTMFRTSIDSRVTLTQSTLSLVFSQDTDSLLTLSTCNFVFNIQSIVFQDRSLQRFEGFLRRQLRTRPATAICRHLVALHRARPLFLLGVHENMALSNGDHVTATLVLVGNQSLHVAYGKAGVPYKTGEILTSLPVDPETDAMGIYFPADFLSAITRPPVEDFFQTEFLDVSNFRINVAEHFENISPSFMDSTAKREFTMDVRNIAIRLDRAMSLVVDSTLAYNMTSACSRQYQLFSLGWVLELAIQIKYNNRLYYLGVADTRSTARLLMSNIGSPKNLSKLLERLGVGPKAYVMQSVNDRMKTVDFLTFVKNPGVFKSSSFRLIKNYLVLGSNTSPQQTSSWRVFGTTFSGDAPFTISSDMGPISNLNPDGCHNVTLSGVSSGAAQAGGKHVFMAMIVAATVCKISSLWLPHQHYVLTSFIVKATINMTF